MKLSVSDMRNRGKHIFPTHTQKANYNIDLAKRYAEFMIAQLKC